jgi:hypothetical protein
LSQATILFKGLCRALHIIDCASRTIDICCDEERGMTSWMAERDKLLAQADALSQSSAVPPARTPPSATISEKPHERPLTPQPRPLMSAPPAVRTPVQPGTQPPRVSRPATESEADHQPLTFRRHLRSEGQSAETLPIPRLASSERDDIEIRVTRFRELQTKIAMEREAHYARERVRMRNQLSKKPQD